MTHHRSIASLTTHTLLALPREQRVAAFSELAPHESAQLIEEIAESQTKTHNEAIIEVFSLMADYGLSLSDLKDSFVRDAV